MADRGFHLRTAAILPAPLGAVFAFFADAHNLERLTPPWLHFQILTPAPIVMQVGTRIDYRLALYGLPIRWQSEITTWDPPHQFVDTQRRGPYRRWVHTHRFEAVSGGTRVIDEVDYAVPFAVFTGRWVSRDVARIFAYRAGVLRATFTPEAAGSGPSGA